MDPTERIRAIFMALPEVTERPSHGAPTWFIRDKKSIATFWADGHHQDEFPHLWCAAPPGAQEALIAGDPAHYFRPPYVGHRGWVGVRVDATTDWSELTEIAEDAFRTVAPKTLIARLDQSV
ncbi:MAG: MmcQ/YjbR family DNA-binding protein [Hamadaea sp.]|nr:MmcQ/YjbR family DNA-binding protein [Hamadaea sp.]